jgi:cyclophilin family peptidyl-prolyl cis-trans isomerase
MVATPRRLACSALLLAGVPLAGCGTGTGGTPATAASHSASVGKATVDAPKAVKPVQACQRVKAPAAKSSARMAKPRTTLDPSRRYVVTFATNCGKIAIELDVRRAPRTTSSFAYLVKRRFYDDLTFHRVAAGFVIQGGDPNGDGSGGPGYTVVERPPSNLRYTRGTVAMAKTETDPSGASGSQFFIVTARDAPLPPQYALVGRVVGSFAAVKAIGRLSTDPPQDGAPTIPVVISRARLSVLG